MSEHATAFDPLQPLLSAMLDGRLAAGQIGQLRSLLRNDPAARKQYVRQIVAHTMLQWVNDRESVVGGRWSVAGEDPVGAAVELPHQPGVEHSSNPQSLIPNPSTAPPLPSPLSTIHYPLSTIHYLATDHPFIFSYMVATVIFGIAALCGWVYKVEHYTEFARHFSDAPSPIAADAPRARESERQASVARVTGLVNCRWSEPKTEAFNGSHISLGRKFALSSGLLQLTYDTGARVILQGPCTYEVESPAGGFLSLGKLTARVESAKTRAEGGPRRAEKAANPKSQISKSQISNPQSLIPNPSLSTLHSPLFTIKTPTAVVTDLGTEFGVEVQRSGATAAYVFAGVVELQSAAANGEIVRLTANESAQVVGSKEDPRIVRAASVDPTTFVRVELLRSLSEKQRPNAFRRWQAHSEQLRKDPSLVAYYDFQLVDGRPGVLRNLASDSALDGVIENATWTDGRMPGKHALLFNGPADYVRVNLPQKVDDLTLAAWVYVEPFANYSNVLLMSDGWKKDGLICWQLGNDGCMGFDVYDSSDSSGRMKAPTTMSLFNTERLRRWTHLAVVYEHGVGITRFYVDGHSLGQSGLINTHVPICIGAARIGHWDFGSYVGGEGLRNFRGRIDELAIFGRPLKWDEIRRMFENGSPRDRAAVGAPALRSASSEKERMEGGP